MSYSQKVKKHLLRLLSFSRKKNGWWEDMEFYHDRFGYVQPYQKSAGKKENTTALWFLSLSEKVKLAWNNVISEVMVFLGLKKEYDPFGYQKDIKIHRIFFFRKKSFFSFLFMAVFAGAFFVYIPLAINSRVITDKNDLQKGIGGFTPDSVLSHQDFQKMEQTEKKKELLMQAAVSIKEEAPATNIKPVKRITYKTRPGESFASVAKKFHVSVASIAGSSGIREIDELIPGTVLSIPTQNGFFLTVKSGNRLQSLLTRYHVDYEDFLALNPGVDPDLLRSGDVIFLPGANPGNLISGWLRPVASRVITSGYGWRWLFGRKNYHKGLDLKAPYVPVRATKSGRVKYAGWLGSYGNTVIITHDNGYQSMYAHLSRIYVHAGMEVSRGKTIGKSGNTGYSFGPHLHFEITKNGQNINPGTKIKGLRYSRR